MAQAFPAIRQFDIATLEKLGRELYRQDQLAWVATDVVLAKIGQATLAAGSPAGWVVDVSGEKPLVRFLRQQGDGVEAAYDVRFEAQGEPVVETPADRHLTEKQLAQFHALQAAKKELLSGRHPLWKGPYNHVLLDDPAGSGFLVYFLRPKPARDVIPVGGHYRVTVSADGKSVVQVDRLFASFLTVDKRRAPGEKVEAAIMSHIVSDTPLETHVFLSLQDSLPFYVITPDKKVWKVDAGSITADDVDASQVQAPDGGAK